MVLFVPAWSEDKPLSVELRETLDERGFTAETKAAVNLGNMILLEDDSKAEYPTLAPNPESFVHVTSSSGFIEKETSRVFRRFRGPGAKDRGHHLRSR